MNTSPFWLGENPVRVFCEGRDVGVLFDVRFPSSRPGQVWRVPIQEEISFRSLMDDRMTLQPLRCAELQVERLFRETCYSVSRESFEALLETEVFLDWSGPLPSPEFIIAAYDEHNRRALREVMLRLEFQLFDSDVVF